MTKEKLQTRLDELNAAINQNITAHNEMIQQRDGLINESMARHNMLIGQRNEVADWLSKCEEPA